MPGQLPSAASPAETADLLRQGRELLDKLPADVAGTPGATLQALADKLAVPPVPGVPGVEPVKSLDALADLLSKLPKP